MAENNLKTSFIPTKKTQPVGKGGALRGNKGVNFVNVIAIFVFVVTLLVAAGVFFYKFQLQNHITSQREELVQAQRAFDPDFINKATLLDNRIESVKKLLLNHKSPSQVFALLEQTTLQTVQFTSLEYSTAEDGKISLSATGVANDFESVVLQSDSYGDTGYLRDILFSGLQNRDEGVLFNLEGTVDSEFVLYRNSLASDRTTSASASDNDDDNSGQAIEAESGDVNSADAGGNNVQSNQ